MSLTALPPRPTPAAAGGPATTPPAAADRCDVLVIGGGPAGATAAALLARQGRDVVLLEKARHPRFHIGESLLPANVPLLEALGLREQVAAIGLPKWGAEFIAGDGSQGVRSTTIAFADAWDKSQPMAWQVRRDAFDALLFGHAARCGARTHEGCRAQAVRFDADGRGATVEAVQADGTPRRWHARYVIDASGRDTLLARQQDLKRPNPRHNSAAIYGHFRGAARRPGDDPRAGDISIFWFAHGWFWFIPLADGTTSVGATCWPYYLKQREQPLEDFFRATIALCPPLAARLQGAALVDGRVHATGNYSYGSTRASGARHALLGDAYAFIDPVFSSGVYLAMASAFAAVPLVQATLDGGRMQAWAARRRFERHMRRGPREFSWFIYRMTNPVMRELILHPRNVLRAKEAVLSVLAGDVYGRSPIGPSLAVFRTVYRVASLVRWRSAWQARQRRREQVRDHGPLRGETVAVQP